MLLLVLLLLLLLLCLHPAVTNASRTNLMDLSTLNWHTPFLSLFRMPPGIMPRIASNAEVYGHVAEGPLAGVPIAGGCVVGQCACLSVLAGFTGFGSRSCPFLIVLRLSGFFLIPPALCVVPCYAAGCLGDQMAALLGQRAAPGEAKNTYGTGCFMLLNTGSVRGVSVQWAHCVALPQHCTSRVASTLSPSQPAHTVPASVPQLVSLSYVVFLSFPACECVTYM